VFISKYMYTYTNKYELPECSDTFVWFI